MTLLPLANDHHPRVLGVFAHPDDEVFCAGGALAQWAATGSETMVVTATHGEAGQIQDAHAATRRTLGAVREQELRVACGHLGVQRVECLGYPDGALREVDEAMLTGEVAAYIRGFRPDVVITFGSDGGYGHPDHVAISAATTRACQRIARADGRAPHLYYSVFPRQHRLLCHLLARWLAQRGSRFRGSEAFVRALALVAEEAVLLGYADDTVEVRWFPTGLSIVEQGEPGTSLYLILSGHADVIQESERGTQRVRRRLRSGEFFGQQAFSGHQPHAASVVATDAVTCLVLSPHAPLPFDGRGSEARLGATTVAALGDEKRDRHGFISVDVSAWLDRKIAALTAHHTQFLMGPEMFPTAILEEWLGSEYFINAVFSTVASGAHAPNMRECARRQAVEIPA
jgi:LmbE family N-acetylglucosaminyl deacetylase